MKLLLKNIAVGDAVLSKKKKKKVPKSLKVHLSKVGGE